MQFSAIRCRHVWISMRNVANKAFLVSYNTMSAYKQSRVSKILITYLFEFARKKNKNWIKHNSGWSVEFSAKATAGAFTGAERCHRHYFHAVWCRLNGCQQFKTGWILRWPWNCADSGGLLLLRVKASNSTPPIIWNAVELQTTEPHGTEALHCVTLFITLDIYISEYKQRNFVICSQHTVMTDSVQWSSALSHKCTCRSVNWTVTVEKVIQQFGRWRTLKCLFVRCPRLVYRTSASSWIYKNCWRCNLV